MGSFFLHLPLLVVVLPPVVGGVGVVGCFTRISFGNPSV